VCAKANIAISPPLVARYVPLVAAVIQWGVAVRGHSGACASARIWRLTGLAGVVLCLLATASAAPALADRRPQPNPEVLWRAYPLEQKPAAVAKAPPAANRPGQRGTESPASAGGGSSSNAPPWALLAAIAVAAALLVLSAISLRRRRRPTVASSAAAAPPPPPAPPAEPAPRRPAARANGPTAAARKAPVCQVHWNRRGAFFYAVMVDPHGVEHMIARSPRVDWHGFAPPEETPETRAALRQLAKQVRERGWRPLRAKGMDFQERRWYARRFRWPTEEEQAAAVEPDMAGEADGEVAGRSEGTR
jgi:hypothetical protein